MISLIWVVFHSYLILVPRTGRILHERLLKVVMHAPLSFFTSTDTGQTINRFSQDMTLIDVELPAALIEFTASICIGTMRAIMICLSAAYFAAVLPFVLVVMYFLQKFYLRTSRQIRLMDLEAKSPLYSNFIETLNGLVTIRAFGWAKNFEEHSLVLLDASQRPFYLLYCIQRWLGLVLDLVVAGLAVILMVLMVKLRGQLDPGLVGVALLNVMSFNISLTRMIKFWTSLETSMGAISRLKSFTTMTISEDLPNEIEPVHEKWPMHGRIEYVNVSAAYTTLGNDVLRDLNLVIPAGQKIGVCGKSGSGKSSLITSLFRMLEITEGTLTIDGVDLSTVSRQTIRERLNAIPQDPIFIKGTIRANLDPLFRSSDLAIEDALKRVGLWNIINIAGGLDISREPETLLSQGQRQIFCLARAILNPSQIVILDEVTASVDMHTDELMQRIIREEFKGRTIIAVAHRLQTILDFDRIVVLDKGRLVECGKPQELLDRAGGSMFRDLWDA
jgi:ATP-binding cassette subfamily C (CFTR/MRP) protein 1